MSSRRIPENRPRVNERGTMMTEHEVASATGIDPARLRELVPARARGLSEIVYLAADPREWVIVGAGR